MEIKLIPIQVQIIVKMEDLYEIFAINSNSSFDNIKRAYQKLILKYHPDKHANLSEELVEQNMEMFIKIDKAWKILSDPQKRKEYDTLKNSDELNKKWACHEEITLEDMEWKPDEKFYNYSCRCGGLYILEEDLVEDLIVCCDTCSLSILVKFDKGASKC